MANIMNFEDLITKELLNNSWIKIRNGDLTKDNKMVSLYNEIFHCYKINKDDTYTHIIDYSIYSDDKMLKFFLEL